MINARMYNHLHNSLIGSAIRSKQDYRRIITAPSTTLKAKKLADQIMYLQSELEIEIRKHRIGQDGSKIAIKSKKPKPDQKL